jgi:hypothetical protein
VRPDKEDVVGQRECVLHQHPPDRLIHHVVTAHILGRRLQHAVECEQARRVQPARVIEHGLRIAKPVGKTGQHRSQDAAGPRQRRGRGFERLDRQPTAHPARRVAHDLPPTCEHTVQIVQRSASKSGVDDILLVGWRGGVIGRRIGAVSDCPEVFACFSTPSENRKPAASFRSAPGVRMITAKGRPCSRSARFVFLGRRA